MQKISGYTLNELTQAIQPSLVITLHTIVSPRNNALSRKAKTRNAHFVFTLHKTLPSAQTIPLNNIITIILAEELHTCNNITKSDANVFIRLHRFISG
ncbi:hypothetical protein AAIG28_23285 [Citrobacter freundii]|uniref:hypothetical protein n=1 Tax=Citrobacter freundii TaxID=546 RepID=UPI0024E0E95C|nr:hypothetical protein [Citrobacter freundii]EKV5092628.1 hypothetical protein [Citrobacter freundii]ELN4556651.1 hypothetical protein [Citrobacter freundii]MDT7261842.1 hypothetical protein [Citrobacter freundii]WOR59860.1 hypothetical protein R4T23_21495 [Citrobacter freundii]HBM8272647.1 hypothetical protein [Citrobacter freundii]